MHIRNDISKEGRKYGIGLVVISQRPSEVNRTVLSQSNNFIAMRLTNVDDQSVVKRLLPDSLGDYAEMLPILDIGEALVVGDASLLPSRIRTVSYTHLDVYKRQAETKRSVLYAIAACGCYGGAFCVSEYLYRLGTKLR